jgi:hypothetical protein
MESMAKALSLVLALVFLASAAWAQSSAVTVGTTAVEVGTAAGRTSFIVKNAKAASANVHCAFSRHVATSGTNAGFEIAAGEALIVDRDADRPLWCIAVSGSQTIYLWEAYD